MLVRTSIDVGGRQLFGCRVGDHFTGEIERKAVGVNKLPGYSEVGEQYLLFTIGGLVNRMFAGLTLRCSVPRLFA
jgi:hypothetical protein